MTKTVKATRKASATSAREMSPAERKKRIAALCSEVNEFWKGQPDTGSVAHLVELRRGVV
jgi:hypothetical protein